MMKGSKSYTEYSSSFSTDEFGYDQNRSNSYSFNGPCINTDPEIKRKKRVASYNLFATEEKLKSTLKNGFKWIKNKFSGDDNSIRYNV
ncbi:hypothetical protein Bca4012_043956 [Brassica carinata]|uniref:Uncharacterized protein n=1 Tax=Brassica carinata TaxID=52824 RepID=A0A8X7QTI9_BRACI|nr:PREDICTED: uncharacterized protein LOC106315974 [Brassica oleracea var. oleracea]XP_013690423.1 uncharacterized protein BNAC09G24800D [Brassica napus]KAG2275906.1 hypothetical protein Bca52824_058461 [Brassica carinata]